MTKPSPCPTCSYPAPHHAVGCQEAPPATMDTALHAALTDVRSQLEKLMASGYTVEGAHDDLQEYALQAVQDDLGINTWKRLAAIALAVVVHQTRKVPR